jgi:hypothetical protein
LIASMGCGSSPSEKTKASIAPYPAATPEAKSGK